MDEDFAIEDLVEEYLELRRAGNAPDVAEFSARYPEHAAELTPLLRLALEMEREGGSGGGDRTVRMDAEGSASPGAAAVIDADALRIPDFHLTRKLGAGGMGTVFEAVQISLGRRVAVKILSPELFSDAVQREQFENEARVIAMLHHPNIVKVLSAGHCSGYCYYAMELIAGKRLDTLAVSDPREVARIGLQVARALAYAHRCGVMHRDIKPANLPIDADGDVRMCDFGIAPVLAGDGGIVEKRGSRSGTVRYMAPERLADGINTFSCDQYALGATLYEMISRQPLFTAPTQKELIQLICTAPVAPLRCRERDLAAIIDKSVSYRPEDRYADMEEMAEDLQHFLNREPVAAAPPSPWRRLCLWAKRKPAVAALTLALFCCAVLLFAATAAGLIRTRAALKQTEKARNQAETAQRAAERNAAVADETLTQVFDRMAELPATPKNKELLSSLLPYYRTIAGERRLPPGKLAILGTLAMRCGDYALAEKAYREILDSGNDAAARNRLALAVERRNRRDEARELRRQVAEEFAEAPTPADRFAAATALVALAKSPDAPERTRAFGILEKLLAEDPKNPEYRFQYALLLAGNPGLRRKMRIPGVEPDAFKLLLELASAHPERPEYGVELVKQMFARTTPGRGRGRAEFQTALEISERLLGRWPNHPEVVAAVTLLHREYISSLRENGEATRAARVEERLLNILELVFYNSEVPEEVRDELVSLQLDKLEALKKTDGFGASALAKKIERELEFHRGANRAKFAEQLKKLRPTPEEEKELLRRPRPGRRPPEGRPGRPGYRERRPPPDRRPRRPRRDGPGRERERE